MVVICWCNHSFISIVMKQDMSSKHIEIRTKDSSEDPIRRTTIYIDTNVLLLKPLMSPIGMCPWCKHRLHRLNCLIPFHEQIASPKKGHTLPHCLKQKPHQKQLQRASFTAIVLQHLKCLWTLMIQHFKRTAHVWHSRALGQEEKACSYGKYLIRSVGCVVWSESSKCPTAETSKKCNEKQVFQKRSFLAVNTDGRCTDVWLCSCCWFDKEGLQISK